LEIDIPNIKNQRLLREINKCNILEYILKNGKASRVELAQRFLIDKKTVTNIVNELLGDNLLIPAGLKESVAGRRQELLTLNSSYRNYIGLDLGATHIIGIITDFQFSIKERIFYDIRPGLPVEVIINQIKTILKSLLSSEKVNAEVTSIGMCVPGFINPKSGISIIAENIPGWKNIKLKENFEKEFHKNFFIEDSSRALGLAEKWIGSGKDQQNFIVLDLGYGIGMAMFADGKLYTGSSYKSGEIGHMIMEINGQKCVCGNRGCLETVASGKALAMMATDHLKTNSSGILYKLIKGKPDYVTAQDVTLAAEMGDEFSINLLKKAGNYIGVALANAVNILNPSTVIIGGGLISTGDILVENIIKSVKRNTMMGILDDIEIKCSQFDVNGSALGCALLAMRPLFEPGINVFY
jgi:glucokinase-like ROK family protein